MEAISSMAYNDISNIYFYTDKMIHRQISKPDCLQRGLERVTSFLEMSHLNGDNNGQWRDGTCRAWWSKLETNPSRGRLDIKSPIF